MPSPIAVGDGPHKVIACLVWGLLLGAAHAQEPARNATQDATAFRYKFFEGENHRYRVTQTATLSGEGGDAGSFEVKTEQVTDLLWSVVSVDDEGRATIRQTVPKVKFTNSSPIGEVGFDSELDEPPMGAAAMLAPAVRTLLEEPVTFVVSAVGEVGEITATKDLIGALERVPGTSGVVAGKAVLRSLIESVLPPLPIDEKPAKRSLKSTGSEGELAEAEPTEAKLLSEYQYGELDESGVLRLLAKTQAAPGTEDLSVTKSTGVTRLIRHSGQVLNSETTLTLSLERGGVTADLEQKTTVVMLDD